MTALRGPGAVAAPPAAVGCCCSLSNGCEQREKKKKLDILIMKIGSTPKELCSVQFLLPHFKIWADNTTPPAQVPLDPQIKKQHTY